MGAVRAFSPHRRWTDAEIGELRARYATTPRSELQAYFPQRQLRAVECKANALGLAREKSPKIADDERLRRKRESMARRRAADIDKARAYEREFYYRNHEANKATMRAYAARRFFWVKAMKLRKPGGASVREIARLWKAQRGVCALTGRRLDRSAQLDHILPKARGGNDSIGNLRWTCEAVNIAKRDMTDAEFLALCGECMAWIGKRIQMVEEL